MEVHLSDENKGKGGELDKRCLLEARIAGREPLAVDHKAPTMQLAIDGATEKLVRALAGRLDRR